MWLMTTRGFVSVVQHDSKPDIFLVRARDRSHLTALEDVCPGITDLIRRSPKGDYIYRAEVTHEAWVKAVARITLEVDYRNFKSAVYASEGRTKYEDALHRVWTVMTSLETGFSKRFYGRWDDEYARNRPGAKPRAKKKGKAKKG